MWIANLAVTFTGRDEIVVYLCAWADSIHVVLVKLVGCRVAEAVEDIGAVALVVVWVFLVGDVLDEDRWVEVDE